MCLGKGICEAIDIVEDAVRAITLFLLNLTLKETLIIELRIIGVRLIVNKAWIVV
jgi:hypothetical protein